MVGVFITKGMTVGVPPGGLSISIDENGNSNAALALHVHFDVCPTWLRLAFQQAREAKKSQHVRQTVWSGSDEEAKASALEQEFEASMQSVVAVAVAFDALYALLRPHTKIEASSPQEGKKSRSPRYAKVSETLRQACGVSQEKGIQLRKELRQIFSLRDRAVHPEAQVTEPVLHPELNVGVEWRFALFRAQNAEIIIRSAVGIIRHLASCAENAQAPVRKIMNILNGNVDLLLKEFTEPC
jgi:hypothetical protein